MFASICLFFIATTLGLELVQAQATTPGVCCDVKVVSGLGALDGTYNYLPGQVIAGKMDLCTQDQCVYNKDGNANDFYCFIKSDPKVGDVKCQAPGGATTPSAAPPSGTTSAGSVDALNAEKDRINGEITKLQNEINELGALKTELNSAIDLLKQLLAKLDTTKKSRYSRQAVETLTCAEYVTRTQAFAAKDLKTLKDQALDDYIAEGNKLANANVGTCSPTEKSNLLAEKAKLEGQQNDATQRITDTDQQITEKNQQVTAKINEITQIDDQLETITGTRPTTKHSLPTTPRPIMTTTPGQVITGPPAL